MIFHILSEISFPQAKLLKAKRNHAKEKALHNQLLTEAGLLEWELEEAKYKYQQMVPRIGKSGRDAADMSVLFFSAGANF